MDEQRKYAILFAATILAARKLNEDRKQALPARECAIGELTRSRYWVVARFVMRTDVQCAETRINTGFGERVRNLTVFQFFGGILNAQTPSNSLAKRELARDCRPHAGLTPEIPATRGCTQSAGGTNCPRLVKWIKDVLGGLRHEY